MAYADLIQKVISYGENQKLEELKSTIVEANMEMLNDAIQNQIHQKCGLNFWQYLLRGFSLLNTQEFKQKRYLCVKTFLNELSIIELPYKVTYDLIARLCADLNTFTTEQLIETIEFSIDFLRRGDQKCIGWNQLLPETLQILSNQTNICVNDMKTTGLEYRAIVIKNLFNMKWPQKVLTQIANMFVDIKLTNDEIAVVLTKFSKNLLLLEPVELPPLAFQLFTLCQNGQHVLILIFAFEEFFYRYYYKKLYSDMDSNSMDLNSIDKFSDKELREAEETILHHLSFTTRFKISEQQICTALRNFLSIPEIILTPFVISACLSMTQVNREANDTWLSSSHILQFLKSVIKTNEQQKELSKYSLWSRDILQTPTADTERVFNVLIDQNNEGKDVVTPGLVNLAFVCLKANNSPELNRLGKKFLQKFLKKRFIFGQGIITKLSDWMILDQDCVQYSECLTSLAYMDSFTVAESIKTINYLLDFFLWIPEDHAMRMLAFLLPVIKISNQIRDNVIDMLRKALYSNQHIQVVGVYGFCMLLKQLNNNNSQRGGSSGMLTQYNISGYSLMTQARCSTLRSEKHFDNLTLEIIGCLRRCFNAPLNIKETLYENLVRALEINVKLIPHILEFIDNHFRSYFNVDDSECVVLFDKLLKISDENDSDVEIVDDLGKLTNLVGFATILCDRNNLNYDTTVLKSIIKATIDSICSKNLLMIEMTGPLNNKMHNMAIVQLNFIESLMCYSIWTSTTSNENIQKIENLFMNYKRISNDLKNLLKNKKKDKKTNNNDSTNNDEIRVKKPKSHKKNNWDLPTIEKFLRLIFDEVVSFAKPTACEALRSNRDLVYYVLQVANDHFESLRYEPDYKQISHSMRTLKNLTEVTRVIFERCIKKLQNLWSNFSIEAAFLSANNLLQSLKTAKLVFHRKFETYLKGIDLQHYVIGNEKIVTILHDNIERSLKDYKDLESSNEGQKIPIILLNCLEILYEFIPYDDPLTFETFSWLKTICATYEMHSTEVASILHKILFTQRLKTHSAGTFFNDICLQLENLLGQIEDKEYDTQPISTSMKSITENTAESTFSSILNIFRKQIEDVEFYIQKVKSSFHKLKIITDENESKQCLMQLKIMERSICKQLVDLSNSLYHLTNIRNRLGASMDSLLRLLMQFYICLTNLMKHFIIRNTIHGIKLEQVIKSAGKPLSNRIYSLIIYIDEQIVNVNSQRKQANASLEKAKIIKETKYLPKLIMRLENFNKFVIFLSKKIQDNNLSNCLHIGTVRDYRIKLDVLRDAINETLSNSSQIRDDPITLEHEEEQEEEKEEDEEKQSKTQSEVSGKDEGIRRTKSQFLRNTRSINDEIRKRKSEPDKSVSSKNEGEEPKLKRTRKSRK